MPLDLRQIRRLNNSLIFFLLFLLLVFAKNWLVVDIIDLIGEFNPEITPLNPGCFNLWNH